ncbi:hypothetical protein Pmani_020227 [Petrolisthes manimaculis]|uniref:Centrosomal protein of 131 kDa n=1 Tax=Petrolisthes manimaculis TaxID=1843537 RepID=A0AAE1U397_9EUCA|nr:hypothetical protein Pmani_020227 [Petrolisthes manimaculis]
MLEERPGFRKRVGSARLSASRVGSARQLGSRGGSSRQAGGRIGSARPSSDIRRPKLHTGRPASAPPGRVAAYTPTRPPPLSTPGFVKFKDVGHLNLKVEGKSIRSVAYSSGQLPQPVSRGSLRVVSSHGHSIQGRSRQFISSYEAGSDSESSSMMGFGSTYTLPLNPNHPINYSNTIASQQSDHSDVTHGFGNTYTKEEHRLDETYTQPSPAGENFNYLNRSDRVSPDGKPERSDQIFQLANLPINFFIHEHEQQTPSTDESRDSFALGDAMYNVRPQHLYRNAKIAEAHSIPPRSKSGDLGKRDIDTTSNDGSESTVMSLGQKIQIMAKSPECRRLEENWDSEWKQLLKQNHELLLKLSSREDHPPENMADSSRNIEVHDSGVQTVTYIKNEGEAEVKEKVDEQETPRSPEEKLSFDSDPIDAIFESNHGEGEDVHSPVESYVPSKSPECVLEDILEESSNSDKSSPRVNEKDKRADLDSNISRNSDENHVNKSQCFSPAVDFFKNDIFHSTTEMPSSPEPSLKLSSISPGKPLDPSSSDFSCTADLPTYHPGSAITCLVRTSSRLQKDKQARTKPSKDLLDALKMIEEDEKRTSEEKRTKDRFTGSETELQDVTENEIPSVNTIRTEKRMEAETKQMSTFPSSQTNMLSTTSILSSTTLPSVQPPVATLPVLQVLVEKVFLFTQDLADRWTVGSDGTEWHEELLRQVVEAERLLEGICVSEGRKRDPNIPPEELHVGCREEATRRQQESDSRIQRNLELIRKLMDDKRLLTEQCEEHHRTARVTEKKHTDKIKLLEENHKQDIKNLKERIAVTEQDKRDKWTRQKTQAIKETTYRGLETKMKDLSAKHRDEVSQLKAQHWEELRQTEEKFMAQQRTMEEELKKKYEQEKDDACMKEREREQQRVEVEVRQSEQHALSRLDSTRKQHERDLRQLMEEHTRELERQRSEAETTNREATRERERMKEEHEDKIRQLLRAHQEETTDLRHKDERAREEWRQRFERETEEARQRAERETRERLKRQRDREIERAIREVQKEAEIREKEALVGYNNKIKNLRDKYESELSEVESSERGARGRYLEMRSLLAQKEEEIVYLRARLHTQDLELTELQHMFQPPED